RELVLHARRELPVVTTVAPAEARVVVERGHRRWLAKVETGNRAAEIAARCAKVLLLQIEQIAIGIEVGVRVGPGPRHSVGDAGWIAGVHDTQHVLADAYLQCGLAIAEKIVGLAETWGDVLDADPGDARKRQVARRLER